MVFVLILLLLVIVAFSFEWLSPEIVVIIALCLLVFSGIITSNEAFQGFGNDFIIMLVSIFIIGGVLKYNGVIEYIISPFNKLKSINESLLIAIIMIITGVLSAFMNNTAIVSIFISPVIILARKLNIRSSKLLMPMAFASLMGGTCTLIGTSTNVAGSSYIVSKGLQPIGMFELLPIGLPILLLGIIFMITIGKKMLPNNIEVALSNIDIKNFDNAEDSNSLTSHIKPNLKKGLYIFLLFIVAILIGSLKIIPISISFMITALIAYLSKSIPEMALRKSIDWRLLILIGGMSAFGIALTNTGGDKFLAEKITELLLPFGNYGLMAGFMIITVLLTQPMSNAASVLVVLPIALQSAAELGINPRPFAVAVIISASISMIAPFEPASLLVFKPGKYKILDFIKIGGALTFLALIIILFAVPLIWKF
ncbi:MULTISPECIES: SLC13 family permease [unclassified Flavobacterium]|uniref:SLC13 family permease n=1 Tax=unclassified Flavobacterium TaxID=196869 RepID=UPI00131E38F7|nr:MULTISPECIES: SLC13 family permease [unclassified Flavobacterium]